jgi:uncharacterized membrane protein YgdD (TMEM256/DUF423 family)
MSEEKTLQSETNSRPTTAYNWIALGAILCGLRVMLGAFGAHSLKEHLTEKNLATFHTATDYLGVHGLAILLVGILALQSERLTQSLKKVVMFFIAGIAMFSGSLYALAFDGPRLFGPITPLGGLCFMIAWFTLAVTVLKFKKST